VRRCTRSAVVVHERSRSVSQSSCPAPCRLPMRIVPASIIIYASCHVMPPCLPASALAPTPTYGRDGLASSSTQSRSLTLRLSLSLSTYERPRWRRRSFVLPIIAYMPVGGGHLSCRVSLLFTISISNTNTNIVLVYSI